MKKPKLEDFKRDVYDGADQAEWYQDYAQALDQYIQWMDKQRENEIHARIEFKLGEYKTALKNTIASYNGISFEHGSIAHQHQAKGLQQALKLLNKEIDMGTPHDQMHKEKLRIARHKAVERIAQSILQRGQRDYNHKLTIINSNIEEAQNA